MNGAQISRISATSLKQIQQILYFLLNVAKMSLKLNINKRNKFTIFLGN